MARAKSFAEQVAALGQGPTAMINVATTLSENGMKVMPDILVTGGAGGSLDALAAALTKWLGVGSAGPVTTSPAQRQSEL
jgi:hypothetical protein